MDIETHEVDTVEKQSSLLAPISISTFSPGSNSISDRIFACPTPGVAPGLKMVHYAINNFDSDMQKAKLGFSRRYGSEEFAEMVLYLKREGMLGPISFEIGCGIRPATNDLAIPDFYLVDWLGKMDKKYGHAAEMIAQGKQLICVPSGVTRILMDKEAINFLAELQDNPIIFQADLEWIIPKMTFEHFLYKEIERDMERTYLKGYEQVNLFFDRALAKAYSTAGSKGIDSVIASSILNYVDWQSVFFKLDEKINIGGIVIVHNFEGGGYEEMNSMFAPLFNKDIEYYFKEIMGYKIVYSKNDGASLTLVAQKRVPTSIKSALARNLMERPYS